ncbi:MAG TPA: tetratricopeptide repeat protein [Rhizomicrobium sp.]
MAELFDQALVLHGHGRLDEAAGLYARQLAAEPGHHGARHMLGVIRAQQGRFAEAAELIALAANANPDDALAWANLGNVLNALGRPDRALEALDRAVALNPQAADAWNNRGIALQRLGQADMALQSYEQALAVQPVFVPALNNRGLARLARRRFTEALADFDRAMAHEPDNLASNLGRGGALQRLTRHDEALAAFNRALGLAPDHAPGWANRGLALMSLGQVHDARESLERAVALAPDLADAHVSLGLIHLLTGNWKAGWPLLEWRKRTADPLEARYYPQPLWTGAEDLTGKTLYAYIEQGLGDAIQFHRFAALAQARGAAVVLGVHAPLIRLLESATPAVALINNTETPAQFDYHIPLASIPLAVKLLPEAIPATARYLAAEPQRVADWKARLGDRGFRIAIAWQGNESIPGAEGKSFPLAALAGVARLPGVRLISLQKNDGAEQLEQLPDGMAVEQYDIDSGRDAFLDSAAIMENCDLVIACDTAPAHLAGALGVPAWIALKHVPDWRWGLEGDKSPWYPSLRLFRQAAPGDWDSVFSSLERALASRLNRS